MKAVILAGGYGTRLGTVTENLPKPLVEINGKPVLKHIIDRLKSAGINQILVKTHFLPELIIKSIGEEALYYYEPILIDAEESLKRLRPWLDDEDFIVCNGDTISNVNLKDMMAQHQHQTISVLLDNWRCAGYWIYSHDWFENPGLPVRPYRQANLKWADIGTPERLEEARKVFA